MQSGMNQIAKSGALREILLYVLAIGNFINHGLKVGEEGVQGFKIDGLVSRLQRSTLGLLYNS